MVALSCDGDSVMMGSKPVVDALLWAEEPSRLSMHCMAHRLELSLKDSSKKTKLYDKTVNVLAIGILYFYGLLVPTRVGRTRWTGPGQSGNIL